MLDINFIRENSEKVKERLGKRLFTNLKLVDKTLELDGKRKKLIVEVEDLRSKRNKAAKEKDIATGKKIKEELLKVEPQLVKAEKELEKALMNIPNLPDEDVSAGREENRELMRQVGELPKFDFHPKDHLDLGIHLGILDVERAVKISGTRFAYLKGDGVLLEFALVNFALEKLIKKGFLPISPPMLIKKEITDKLGYWHGGGNENYYLVKDAENDLDLYLVGTGEHSVVPMHSGEIFVEKELPKKYVAFSSCFRREAGTYGKDTRGILRVHQFDKVEMVAFVKPEDGEKTLKELLEISEGLMQDLKLPYQVVKLAAGDIGFPTAKTFDIETWLPGQGKYRETHSISTTTDYQARRLNIKYEAPALFAGGKPSGLNFRNYVYILNGTAFAIGRTITAILENYQQKDGSVKIPKVLQKWMGKEKITSKF